MATLSEALRWAQMLAFLVVGAWAVTSWIRHRRPTHAWLAVTFGSLAVVAVSGPVLEQLEGVLPAAVSDGIGRGLVAVLTAFPYALVRLLDTFDPVPAVVRRVVGVTALMLAVSALVLSMPDPGGTWEGAFLVFVVVLVISWVAVLPGVAWRFWQVGAGRPNIARRRLRALAAAVATLALALLLLVAVGADPAPGAQLASQVTALVAAALLVLGAVPPPWLRSWWRQPEEAALHRAALGLMAASTPEDVAAVLVPHLRAVVAARGTAVVYRARVLAEDGRADAAHALRVATGSPGEVAPAETVDWEADEIRVWRQPLSDGAIVVWTDAATPFVGDEERRLLTRTALLADLALQRAELLASERQARIELADANEELESFVYSASHDLKSPLIAMLGYIDVLTEEHGQQLDGDAAFYLQRLVTNGRYMESLIRDLLELSRIGRLQTVREEVDLDALLVSLEEELTARHPQLRIDHDPLPVLWGNSTRLRQLLVNLLDNAVRHGADDGVHVEVRVTGLDDGGVELVVSDDGPGIPEAYRERVFGVFERLDGDDRGGTGIGLAICRKVVETLGGRIWLGAGDGGARFHIRLPAAALADRPSSPECASGRTDQEVLT